jgi:hypothetical protein
LVTIVRGYEIWWLLTKTEGADAYGQKIRVPAK